MLISKILKVDSGFPRLVVPLMVILYTLFQHTDIINTEHSAVPEKNLPELSPVWLTTMRWGLLPLILILQRILFNKNQTIGKINGLTAYILNIDK